MQKRIYNNICCEVFVIVNKCLYYVLFHHSLILNTGQYLCKLDLASLKKVAYLMTFTCLEAEIIFNM